MSVNMKNETSELSAICYKIMHETLIVNEYYFYDL